MHDWDIQETKKLFDVAAQKTACGEGLGAAFRLIARESGRTPGSVRNYYYAQLKTFAMLPEVARTLGIEATMPTKKEFVPFTQTEIDDLIALVLTERAKGESVRAVIARAADFNPKTALRLQNKYRSVVTCHPERVKKITTRLKADGKTYFDPYLRHNVSPGANESDELAPIAELIRGLSPTDKLKVVRMLTEG